MIHTDEDDEFDRVKRENAMREVQRLGQEIEATGQPYHFESRAEWKSLTEKEVVNNFGRYYDGDTWFFARDLEAYIRQKNS
jgi:hypothetical protein